MTDSPFELRLSQAADWVKCAAYPRMNRSPQAALMDAAGDHTVREEGTAIHWAAECMLRGQCVPNDLIGKPASNGVMLDDELLDVAALYVSVLNAKPVDWHIEELLHAPDIHPKCGGTPDAYGFNVEEQLIEVADCKGGFRFVDAWINWQLLGYLSAILTKHPEWRNARGVRFTIVQPRAYSPLGAVRDETVVLSQCYPLLQELSDAAHVAAGDTAPAVAGSQCDNCNARASCNVAMQAGMRALEVSGEPELYDLTAVAVDYELLRIDEAIRMLKARQTGLEAMAQHMISNGVTLTHFSIERSAGRLKWIDDDAESKAIAMGDLYGVNLRKPVVAITPTQAADRVPKVLLETYARRNRGAAKLTRFDATSVAKAFSKFVKE